MVVVLDVDWSVVVEEGPGSRAGAFWFEFGGGCFATVGGCVFGRGCLFLFC